MAETVALLLTIYALGTLAALGAGWLLWRHRDRTGAPALLAMMAAMVLWNGSLFFFTLTTDAAVASVLIRLVFVGVGIVSVAKLLFVLEYTGRERFIRPGVLAVLAIPPVLTVFLAVLNPAELFFTTLEATGDGRDALAYEFGPATLVPLIYSYTLNVVITVLLLGFLYRSRAVYRGQSLALFGGALAPWIANMVFILDVVAFDTTAIGSVVSGLLFTVAITRYRLLDIMPIARDRVVDSVSDGVFVVDREDRLVDVNPAGRRMLETIGVETDSLVGRPFPSLFDATDLRERYETATSTVAETTESVTIGSAHFRVEATPIEDGRDRHVGWLLLVHDVTERKRRERRLEAQNERLDRFASLVSHDLRNPLNVANGYLELLREAEAEVGTDADGDDTERYIDEIEAAHDRMETIIDDVLALAREGQAVTDPESVALADLAVDAWDGVETGSASLSIEADATVCADPDRLRRALENLYRNAIEHGTDDAEGAGLEVRVGTIDETARVDGSAGGFYVADDGTGIPAADRDRVLEDGYTTGDEGTGLGLSIVESVATAHDWSVGVTESESGGARFEFRGVEGPNGSVRTESIEGV